MGNRDVNKLRLPFCLSENALSKPPCAYWINNSTSNQLILTKSEKLKWVLKSTMGAPLAFEYRRLELQQQQMINNKNNVYDVDITNDDVTASFLNLLSFENNTQNSEIKNENEQGLVTKYLQYAKIAVLLGDVLIVHAGVVRYNMGWIPFQYNEKTNINQKDNELTKSLLNNNFNIEANEYALKNGVSHLSLENGYFVENLFVWVEKLNQFAASEILDYINRSAEFLKKINSFENNKNYNIWDENGGYTHEQPASRLLQYGMGWMSDKSKNPTVIYASYLDFGKPCDVAIEVVDYFKKWNVSKIIVGHQPNGDAPFIMDKNNFQVITGDTGYSLNTLYTANTFEIEQQQEEPSSDIEDNNIDYTTNNTINNNNNNIININTIKKTTEENWITYAAYESIKNIVTTTTAENDENNKTTTNKNDKNNNFVKTETDLKTNKNDLKSDKNDNKNDENDVKSVESKDDDIIIVNTINTKINFENNENNENLIEKNDKTTKFSDVVELVMSPSLKPSKTKTLKTSPFSTEKIEEKWCLLKQHYSMNSNINNNDDTDDSFFFITKK